MILTWSLKAYAIQFHNLISMNIFLNERSVFLYHFITVKRYPKTNKLLRTKGVIRSSCSVMFFEIGVLKNSLTCKGKHQCWSLFSMNLLTCSFVKKRLQHSFPANITKFLRTLQVAMLLSNHCQY